jgi:RHS repeat-associated protein
MTMNLYDNSGRLIEITDPAGNKTNYKYDIQGRRIETVNALGHSMKIEYDKKGRIVAETNAAGHRTIYRYNPKGQRIAAILPKPDENSESLVIRQFYHRSGQLIGNIAPDGVVHSYLADKFGRNTAAYLGILLEKPTRTIDGKAVYSFDHILPNENYDIFITWKRMEKTEKEKTVRIVDILNATITEHYNSKIDLSVSCKNDSFLVPFCSLPFKRLGNNIEPTGNTIEVEWTGDTKNVAVYLLRSKPISRILYNEKGQVQSQVDARDHSIIYTYDHFGRQISAIRDGDENSCCSEGKTFYNKKRQVIAKLALDGRLSLLKYDMLGRQECSYLGAMVESKFGSYKLEGLPIGEEFDLYVSDSSQKDGETLQLGDMTLVKERTFKAEKSTLSGKLNGAGTVVLVRKLPVQQTKYDFTGRTIKTIDAKQNETLLSYDSLGRQIAVFQPAANNTRLAAHSYYDESGHVVAQAVVPVDAESLKIKGEKRVTRMEYDKLGRAVKTIQPNPNGQKDQNEEIVQRQEYDSSRNVIRKIDPLGYETKFEYNSLNQKISETSAEGGVTKYTYDSAGRMKSLTDPVNNTTSWTYNLIERIAGEHVILEGIQRDRLFFYDASGNIVSKVDRNGRITEWTFDKLNRHTSEVWYDNYESWLLQKTLKKFVTTYNRSGKIASVEDGDNRFVFSYGVFSNEIKQVQTLAGLQKPIEFNYATDIIGLKTETVLKVGNEVDYKNHYEFDSLGRKIKISQVSERAPLKLVNVSYNEFGKLTQQSRFEDNKPVAETKNSYDNLGRLVNISHTNGNNIFADYDILWDAGNRITDFDFTYLNGPPKKKSRYEYDKTSQLIGAKYDFMENEVYKYDTNGNRLNAEIQGQNQSYKTGEYNRLLSNNHDRFEYDAEGNRVSKTSNNGGVTKYSWDNRNRLVKVETPTNTVEYIYDYQNRLVKRTEKSSEMNFIHDGWQIVRQFENGSPTHRYLWGTKQDELLCDNNNWTLGDHLNTIRDIVAMDSGVVLHLEYNAFGKLLAKSINPVDFAYTGKLTDPASGLPWNINRWYDNTVGNWISEDPIGFVAKDTNLIRFVMNQPVKFIDPNGQDIRLKKGIPNQPGPVGLIHQDICVDTWEVNGEKIGERCFSFGRENPKLKWYKTTTSWLGFIGIIPAGCGFQGTIYESTNPGNTVSTHATTQAEDVQWLTFMLGRVGTKDRYTVLRLNCVHYTNLEFAAAVLRFP